MTTTSIVIDRLADDVFAYVTDPTQFHQWQQGVVSGTMEEPGTPTVGSHCTMTRRMGGANRPSTSVVTKMNPPTNWAVHGIDGPIRALVDVTVQALDDARSSVSIDVDFEGHGIGKLLVPLVSDAKQQRRCPPTSPGSRTGWSRAPASG
jgi:Polyketide cyclase / dehydrase and lipid transport